ncbi:tRNA-dihydrouridine(20a/20b) synthase [NAD(P)+]-like [Leptidea sinapis]|uniref:tRNA-dihydrouridine(20a/20b) synthase [NAD(P)+]-like n=1 Tax=Leptidea sinapis TaxID=189913 RepID=UPI0021241281|nr:tRNA-dihydrouridine(20a/20b) synthase [NAD(P)+]-like [Leptidea sinapis]
MIKKTDITELFCDAKRKNTYLKVCAPMVRYSKVQFRSLVRNYGVDLTFTPMILANSFCQNSKARSNEFQTTSNDTPLIVQFAANNVHDFLDASKLVYPYADGVDLNCGCPQRWAIKDGYGCALLSQPEIIHDLVRSVKRNLPNDFTVSVKIRIMNELKKTLLLCQQLEKCGINFMTVHGRLPSQKNSEPIDVTSLVDIFETVQIPCIVNGGVKKLDDADELYESLKCDGVMAASGILTNPAMFSGAQKTPMKCVKLWMDYKNLSSDNITFQCYHHHLVFMLEKILNRQQKQIFNYLSTFEEVDRYLFSVFGLDQLHSILEKDYDDVGELVLCEYDNNITMKHNKKCRGCGKSNFYCGCTTYNCDDGHGSFYSSFIKITDELDYMDTNMFNELL